MPVNDSDQAERDMLSQDLTTMLRAAAQAAAQVAGEVQAATDAAAQAAAPQPKSPQSEPTWQQLPPRGDAIAQAIGLPFNPATLRYTLPNGVMVTAADLADMSAADLRAWAAMAAGATGGPLPFEPGNPTAPTASAAPGAAGAVQAADLTRPTWYAKMGNRDQRTIDLARVYAAEYSEAGLVGHGLLLLIAQLADMLDKAAAAAARDGGRP